MSSNELIQHDAVIEAEEIVRNKKKECDEKDRIRCQMDEVIKFAEDILKEHNEVKRQELIRLEIIKLENKIEQASSDLKSSINSIIKPDISVENIANNNSLYGEVRISDLYSEKYFNQEADKDFF